MWPSLIPSTTLRLTWLWFGIFLTYLIQLECSGFFFFLYQRMRKWKSDWTLNISFKCNTLIYTYCCTYTIHSSYLTSFSISRLFFGFFFFCINLFKIVYQVSGLLEIKQLLILTYLSFISSISQQSLLATLLTSICFLFYCHFQFLVYFTESCLYFYYFYDFLILFLIFSQTDSYHFL